MLCIVTVVTGCGTDEAGGSFDSVPPAATAPNSAPPPLRTSDAGAAVTSIPASENPPMTPVADSVPPDGADTASTASSPNPPQTLIGSCLDDLTRAAQLDASLQTERETIETCNAVLVTWGYARLDLLRTLDGLDPDAPSWFKEAFGSNLSKLSERWNEISSTTAAPREGTMESCIAALRVLEEPPDPSAADAVEATESCVVAVDNADAAALSLAFVCEALALGPDRREPDRLTGDIEAFVASWSLVAD